MRRPPMHAMGPPRQRTRHFRKIMNEHSNEVRIALLKQRIQQLEAERDNALSDFRQADTDSIRALHERNEARGQRDELAEALIEMRYGHTDKAEKMAVKALNCLTK